MSWFLLLRVLLTLSGKVFDFMEKRRLLSEGEARAVRDMTRRMDKRAKKAVSARDAVSGDADKLRVDDGFKRD